MSHAECRKFRPLKATAVYAMTSTVDEFQGCAANERQVERAI